MLQNFQQSSMYRSYHNHIPSYLHDQPRSVIIHRRTNSSNILADNIHDIDSEMEYLRFKKLLEPSTGWILASEAQSKCLLALAKIG